MSLFPTTPLVQVLTQHGSSTHGWCSGSLTSTVFILCPLKLSHTQRSRHEWRLRLLSSSLQLGEHHTTRVFHLDPILLCPRLQNVLGVCGTGFRLLPHLVNTVFVIFRAAHLSSAWKSIYILFIPLPYHLKACSSFHINQTICVPCTVWIPLGQVLSARGQ